MADPAIERPGASGACGLPGHILVVCIGNICRSPMAEWVFRDRLQDCATTVASAGLAALAGAPVDETAESVLQEHGLSASAHVARQLTADMVAEAGLVLVMEKPQILAVHRLSPGACAKTYLLGAWSGAVDIPDPYRGRRDRFAHAYRMIDVAVDSWCTRFSPRAVA